MANRAERILVKNLLTVLNLVEGRLSTVENSDQMTRSKRLRENVSKARKEAKSAFEIDKL